MSFRYLQETVTLENYKSIFIGYSPDVLDEIRSAVLDETPIGNFIKICESDSYKLGQFRMALREYVPPKYLNKCLAGKHINLIRQIYARRGESGLNLLRDYIISYSHHSFTEETFLRILKVVLRGHDISSIDFTRVLTTNIDIVCTGIEKGYPMWLCAEEPISAEMMRLMTQGFLLGVDVHPFLSGDWSEEIVTFILSKATSISVSDLLANITSKFTLGEIEEIVKAMQFNLDWSLLCVKTDEGSAVFNEFQMNVIVQCLIADVLTDDIYDPTLSDMDMQDKYTIAMAAKAKTVGRIGGSLKHGRVVKTLS